VEVAQILVDAWAAENNVMARAVHMQELKPADRKSSYTGVETA
jgi:hypothetical protein